MMTHKVKPNITVNTPGPNLSVIEQELENMDQLPWSKLSKIIEIKIALSGAPISKTRCQKTRRYRRLWVKPELFYILVNDKGRILPQEPALVKPEREFH